MGDSLKPDGEELSRTKSYQWPTGHVSHLSESQLGALEQFKKLSQEKGYYAPGDEKTKPTHDDETLLRYLRARKFVPRDAFTQFKDTEDWRKENQLDQLYETIDIEEYDQVRRLYPQWTGRRDRRGIPLYVYEINSVDPKAVTASANGKSGRKPSVNTKTPWKMLKLFALYENLCRFVLPLCSAIPNRPNPETPISQSNNIVDLGGVGFTKLWKLRNHMSDASQLATSHYPETLDRIFVIGAPGFFPTIWSWAQGWFDPITVSKIFILTPKNTTSTLEKFVDIENIPKKYGGKLNWSFGEMPALEPDIANSLRWKEKIESNGHKTFPIGPIKWQYDGNGDLMAVAIGTENGKSRNKILAGLHPEPGITTLALIPGADPSVSNKLPVAQIPTPPASDDSPATTSTPAIEVTRPRMSSDADDNVGKDPLAHSPSTSRSGHYTVPYHDETHTSSSASDMRQGTSETRYLQQEGTHAEGQLADGTPELKKDGQGERTAIMDPNTVGQAPKEHPLPIPEEPAPSYMDQAKDMAGQAMEQAKALPTTVMNAVGMGGSHEEAAKEEVVKHEDPRVDEMSNKNVEEFLRNQTQTQKTAK